jgi:hypothetical protein
MEGAALGVDDDDDGGKGGWFAVKLKKGRVKIYPASISFMQLCNDKSNIQRSLKTNPEGGEYAMGNFHGALERPTTRRVTVEMLRTSFLESKKILKSSRVVVPCSYETRDTGWLHIT